MKKSTSFTRLKKSILVHRKHYLVILLLIIFNSVRSFGQVAAVSPPTGGFAIDGGLKANTPTTPSPFGANQGDWFPGAGGSGGSVFNALGGAINSATTGRAVDLQASNTDNVFTQGSKFNDYISSLHWGLSGAPDKNDINNALFHISRDGNNDQWVFMAGDRLSTNGTSYIDFEFLQGTITKNANGTFTGSGNAGTSGRTENDMIVSMEYTNGGTKPVVFIYQWKLSGGTWSYQLVQNLNAADAFAETNRAGAEADVPYTVFGSNTYQQFAFVEAGINISNLLELTGQACEGLSIQTLWIKTKASAVSTAALKDFMEPIPVGLSFGSSTIDALGPFCISDNTQYTLVANPVGGTFSGAGVTAGKFRASDVTAGTHLISYAASGCSANTIVTVVALPTISGQAIGAVCGGATSASVSYTSTTASQYKIDWDAGGPDDITNYINLPASPFNITIPGNLSPNTYNGTLYIKGVADPGCTNSVAISLTINANPTAGAGTTPASQCFVSGATGNTFNLSGSGTNGSFLWSVQSKSPNTLTAVITGGATLTPSVKVTGPEAGTVTLRISVTSASCGVATGDVTVTTLTAPGAPNLSYIGPSCLETTFKVTVNDPHNGSTYTLRQLSGGLGPIFKAAPANVVSGKIEFSGLTVGKGYRVTETNAAGCISAPEACGDFSSVEGAARAPSQTMVIIEETQTTVKAYPNPFSDRVKFMVTSSVAGNGNLEVYNMMGQRVKTVYQGYIAAGTQTFELSLPGKQVANLVYVLRIGDKKMTGKILQVNQ